MSDDHPAGRRCQMCDAVCTDPSATACPVCGAALIVRDSIDGVAIPGVTEVDPELKAYAQRPLRIPGVSPSQALAGPAIGAAAAGGGVGSLLALGALAAVAAREFADAGRDSKATDAARLGEPSAPISNIVKRLNDQALADRTTPPPPSDGPTDTDGA
jgi:hypothetical protein